MAIAAFEKIMGSKVKPCGLILYRAEGASSSILNVHIMLVFILYIDKKKILSFKFLT